MSGLLDTVDTYLNSARVAMPTFSWKMLDSSQREGCYFGIKQADACLFVGPVIAGDLGLHPRRRLEAHQGKIHVPE